MSDAGTPDRDRVIAALNGVTDPRSGRGLVEAGLVQGLVIGAGRAGFMLEVANADVELYAGVRDAAEAALRAVPDVEKAQVVLTAAGPSRAARPPEIVRVRRGGAERPAAPQAPREAAPRPSARPDHVRSVIAVASGKGGVGKSTIAVNLACALARLGLEVGLLDADVYGPSIPRMMGVTGEPQLGPERKLEPPVAHGVKVMSIGLLVDEAAPMIWRGPMASSALNQMLNDVAWGSAEAPLDVLVIDMPPGTGDIQLTLAQRIALSGAVIVSTPQDVALIDVRRGAAMFEKTRVPVLGVIENMSYFLDTAGARVEIFGHGGARAVADELGAPCIAEVPIEVALREACDAGQPLLAGAADSPAAQALMAAAQAVRGALEAGEPARAAPRIVFES